MTHTRSYTIHKLPIYTVTYNANGGSGSPTVWTPPNGMYLVEV